MLFKRFFNLFQILQKPEIVGELTAGLRDQRKAVAHDRIQFSGIGLPADRKAGFKAHFLCDLPIQFLAFFVISVKEFQERRLRAGSAL